MSRDCVNESSQSYYTACICVYDSSKQSYDCARICVHDSFAQSYESVCICVYMIHLHSHMTVHAYVYMTFRNADMGWLRLVGSLKLYVSFAKEPYNRDYFLQKSSVILRSLLFVATLYLKVCECMYEKPKFDLHKCVHYRVTEEPCRLCSLSRVISSRLLKMIGLFCKRALLKRYLICINVCTIG